MSRGVYDDILILKLALLLEQMYLTSGYEVCVVLQIIEQDCFMATYCRIYMIFASF